MSSLGVAILAGGRSRRLGVDKALVRLQPDDRPLIQLVLDVASEISTDVTIISSAEHDLTGCGASVVNDRWPGAGPLGGIATALSAAQTELVLVLPCDAPFLQTSLLTAMLRVQQPYDALIPRATRDGVTRLEPLLAIYSVRCLPAIRAMLSRYERKASLIVRHVHTLYFEGALLESADPELRSFLDIDTPEALAFARRVRAAMTTTYEANRS